MHGFGFVVIWRQKNIYLWADTGRERECIRENRMPPAPPREGIMEENGQEGLCFIHQSNLTVPSQSSTGPTSFISLTKSTSHLGPVQILYQRHADTQSFDLKISCEWLSRSHTGAHSLQVTLFEVRHLLSQYSILILLRGHLPFSQPLTFSTFYA